MIIHGNEIMEPEELAQVGSVFDEAWDALSATAGDDSADQRATLASIILRLANLGQLGPEQMKATALRIFRAEPSQGLRAVGSPAGFHSPSRLATEAADCSASTAIAGPSLGA
jgi:hypothetical protein